MHPERWRRPSSRNRSGTRLAAAVVMMLAAPASGFAASTTGCSGCSADPPSCENRVTTGTDSCGNGCSKTFYASGCSAPEPSCSQMVTTGTKDCGDGCSKYFDNYCTASYPACGETTTSEYVCGGTCTRTGGSCSSSPPNPWQPYGFAFPGDPEYGFGLPNNTTRDFLGLAAKGNIVMGDYTRDQFKQLVLPLLQPNTLDNPDGKTQPYVVDDTDASLGYDSTRIAGEPIFNGDYTQVDLHGEGEKLDGTPRRFYESSLPDDEFRALVDSDWYVDPSRSQADRTMIMAALYTNHAMAGFLPQHYVWFFGSIVARDDGMAFAGDMDIGHDVRLLGRDMADKIVLPFDIKRPRLRSWEEVPVPSQ